ncbi:aminopeptidase N [Advenella sp. RU8]|uniref:aminopeptidase N n=1 Tax=Advenella sp. RU8 TaxID=3399575 RepID=UPI003AAFB585
MTQNTPTTIHRLDYREYPFNITNVGLHFDLHETATRITSTLSVSSKENQPADLVLNGEDIKLVAISLNGQTLEEQQYSINEQTLVVPALQGQFELSIVSECNPAENSTLMGLYVSGNSFFTQCEAEGFRRITFFPDRPDVMSIYTVSICADKARYPYLLSNGNLCASTDLPDGRHQVTWEDPFRKPSYLFALVAGDFDIREKRATTQSGRDVLLQVYSDKGSGHQTEWALESLENAMKWDEERFGLELDLDRFMIVAVRDFNMGAMENKGLNIFNAAYVLADPNTATDANYEGIESVIGHEYFHNWTGNRITCRDWFQLSLKEGLTVFRDQEFSADMMARNLDASAAASARAIKRIDDVTRLRTAQFPEDAGPMAHPIRPESYQEIGNFYTATVYEKGAEVIRMQHTLLGEEGFRAGMDEYFRRHDGQAVTCDDFINVMESVYQQRNPGKDLALFRNWYSQAGTPRVTVRLDYDEAQQRCAVTLSQDCAPVGVEKLQDGFVKQPFHIPFAMGFISQSGQPITLHLEGQQHATVLLELKEQSQTWHFDQVPERPIPSLLRDFSAPVIVDYPWTNQELAILCAHDSNPFSRWEAVQELSSRELLRIANTLAQGAQPTLDSALLHVWKTNLGDPNLDAGYRAWLLTLPAEKILAERMNPIAPVAIAKAREFVRQELARGLLDLWLQTLSQHETPGAYSPDPVNAGRRSLKNLALAYLLSIQNPQAIQAAFAQYQNASNMTDRIGALSPLVSYYEGDERDEALAQFYEQWQHDPLVVDKWFALQANARNATAQTILGLMAHPAFNLRNPNRARSLIFQFCINNTEGLHQEDGSGYEFWADQVIALNSINPEIAARLARVMDNWSRYSPALKSGMLQALKRVEAHPGLSKNVFEIVSKALNI